MNFYQAHTLAKFQKIKILRLCQFHKNHQNLSFYQANRKISKNQKYWGYANFAKSPKLSIFQIYRLAKFKKIKNIEVTPISQISPNDNFYQAHILATFQQMKNIEVRLMRANHPKQRCPALRLNQKYWSYTNLAKIAKIEFISNLQTCKISIKLLRLCQFRKYRRNTNFYQAYIGLLATFKQIKLLKLCQYHKNRQKYEFLSSLYTANIESIELIQILQSRYQSQLFCPRLKKSASIVSWATPPSADVKLAPC